MLKISKRGIYNSHSCTAHAGAARSMENLWMISRWNLSPVTPPQTMKRSLDLCLSGGPGIECSDHNARPRISKRRRLQGSMIGFSGHAGELPGRPFSSWGSLGFGGGLEYAGVQILVVEHGPALRMIANFEDTACGLTTMIRLPSFESDKLFIDKDQARGEAKPVYCNNSSTSTRGTPHRVEFSLRYAES
ncbi:hypothetical protein ES702_04579 [subsurface metagenome]